MKKSLKIAVVLSLIIFIFFLSRLCLLRFADKNLLKFADDNIVYIVLDSDTFSKFGIHNTELKRKRALLFFSIFPSMVCPAANDYINNEKNRGEFRIVVFKSLHFFPEQFRSDVLKIYLDKLKNDEGLSEFAAQELANYGKEATPALIEAWEGKGTLGVKSQIADSMIRIGDKSVVPVLIESLNRDKSFKPSLTAPEKRESGEAVYAVIALYEITNDDKYKAYITKIMKRGVRYSRLLTMMFMGGGLWPWGTSANQNMIPFLQLGLKDKDATVRKFAKDHLEMVNKALARQKQNKGQ